MSSLRTWLRGSPASSSPTKRSAAPSPSASASTSTSAFTITGSELSPSEREYSDIEDAMAAVGMIMNDDIDGAETRLRQRNDRSTFHQLGLGISIFIRSILGFEKDIMTEATNRLLECETRAWADLKRAQKEAAGNSGWLGRGSTASSTLQIYPPGSEFALVHAEAQLMLAVVAVLHESLTEAIKGFYKLRKAFIALNTIMESEDNFLRRTAGQSSASIRNPSLDDKMPGTFDDTEFADLNSNAGRTKIYSKTETQSNGDGPVESPQLNGDASEKTPVPVADRSLENGPDVNLFTNTADVFIHSGANMCFGVMMLLISMVPPAFSRLLYIIGFKGDRDRGVRMLWQSTKFANINGGMAGLVLLAYYNGLVAYSEVLPTDADITELASPGEIVGYPRERCTNLLAHMMTIYPESLLWKLEEARILSTGQRPREAIQLLTQCGSGSIRQITALTKFELALDAMCVMDWPLMKETFLQCIELNDWSHALYYYIVGSSELEMYRDNFHKAASLAGDASKSAELAVAKSAASKHKKAAESYFRKAPPLAGKKKFMARQMPFDVFVIRKLAKWEERAKALKLDLADAIGVSPALEMVYLWNGGKRMPPDLLEVALRYLEWNRCTASASDVEQFKTAPDENAIGCICQVTMLRSLRRYKEAWSILQKGVLAHDRAIFKGPTKDDYIPAAGQYEAAVLCWYEACDPESYPPDVAKANAYRQKKVEECQVYLEKVAKWEAFVLDARIGMKVQTGMDTIRWLKKKKNWE